LENVAHLEVVMKLVGLAICLGSIIGAAATVGFHLYFDILSLLFVLGGAIGFLIMNGNLGSHMKNFAVGAVYFGWLGALVGLIVITGNRFMVWGDVEKMGPALAVAMLTILYGYIIKLVTIALTED
jgi:flagellar motor component MotA